MAGDSSETTMGPARKLLMAPSRATKTLLPKAQTNSVDENHRKATRKKLSIRPQAANPRTNRPPRKYHTFSLSTALYRGSALEVDRNAQHQMWRVLTRAEIRLAARLKKADVISMVRGPTVVAPHAIDGAARAYPRANAL